MGDLKLVGLKPVPKVRLSAALPKLEAVLLVLLDASGSMRGRKFDTAWHVLHEELPKHQAGWQVGVISFGSDVSWLRMPEAGRMDLAFVDPSGGTAMLRALSLAWVWLLRRALGARILLISDCQPTDAAEAQIVQAAREHSVIIDCVGIGADCESGFLRELAAATGGIYRHVEDVVGLLAEVERLSPAKRTLLSAPR